MKLSKIAKQVLIRLKGESLCLICEEREADIESMICSHCMGKLDKKLRKIEFEDRIIDIQQEATNGNLRHQT